MLIKKIFARSSILPSSSFARVFFYSLFLSWVYGICSQMIIPLPYNMVPISLQPLPIFLSTLLFGLPGVLAYLFFLIQGAGGLPFFSNFSGGLIKLFGPTGGYLFGFFLGALFLFYTNDYRKNRPIRTFLKIACANLVVFACGLLQLYLFVPANQLLSLGFYPFIAGDFLIKPSIILLVLVAHNYCKKKSLEKIN